jgi:hypothetical protein
MTYKEGGKKRHLIFRTLDRNIAFQHLRNIINIQPINPQTTMYFSTIEAKHPQIYETFFWRTGKK